MINFQKSTTECGKGWRNKLTINNPMKGRKIEKTVKENMVKKDKLVQNAKHNSNHSKFLSNSTQ